jgi:hypothetical protein
MSGSMFTRPSRRFARLSPLLAVAMLVALIAVPATGNAAEPDTETHCVLDVVGVLTGGEFVTSDPVCFDTFERAAAFAGMGRFQFTSGAELMGVRPDLSEPVRAVRTPLHGRSMAATTASSSFVIGIHFTGSRGTGSSVTLTGSNCSGGYWNASSSWRNVISSSYNGCARLAHYSELYISGSRFDTRTSGQTDDITGYMDNRTKSIRYLSS